MVAVTNISGIFSKVKWESAVSSNSNGEYDPKLLNRDNRIVASRQYWPAISVSLFFLKLASRTREGVKK